MTIDNTTKDLLLYMLNHLDSFIENETYEVLADSEQDPHHSAVTLYNLINSYLHVMRIFKQPSIPQDITEYLLEKCFTTEEIKSIHDKKEAELKYYIGRIIE